MIFLINIYIVNSAENLKFKTYGNKFKI